ncbi:MAG: sulfatase-like hydrolase/transferase [Oscillospiraceae bacterium]|nr:sulfatase-like hydrolase/transferase [Oscillospiraceae bacterium]
MPPNIIIINPDQMRADALAHLGNAAAHTPVLDALAQQGVSFSNAFCQNPVCVPSRASVFTGLYPHVHGHRTMNHLLQPHEQNLYGDMKQAGYHTIACTRGDLMAGQFPKYHKQLVDEFIKVKRPRKPIAHIKPSADYSFLDGIIPDEPNLDELLVEGAIRSIKNRPKNKPFFMFLGLFYPHPPYHVEQKYYDLIDKSKLPPRIPTLDDTQGKPIMEQALCEALGVGHWDESRFDELRTIYLAMCAKVDDFTGRVLDALKAEGIYDDTAVLVFSDHGDYTGDFGLVEKTQNCFPECLVRVPLLIKPPSNRAVDSGVNDNLVELLDVFATVTQLGGAQVQRSHFSRSLLPAMADKTLLHREFVTCEGGRLPGETHCSEAEQIQGEFDRYAPRLNLQARNSGEHTKAVMLRNQRYKYIRRLQEQDEFYDLQQGERVNEINNPSYAAQVQTMQQQMLNWLIETCDVVPPTLDERFPKQTLWNNAAASGVPRFAIRLLTGVLGLLGIPVSRFMRWLRGKAKR